MRRSLGLVSGGVVQVFRRLAGDGVFFLGPCAKVDLLAALAAEGAEFVRFGPFDLGATGRAINYWHA